MADTKISALTAGTPTAGDLVPVARGASSNFALDVEDISKMSIQDAITNGVTDVAPSQNAVFDALALKQDLDLDLTAIAGLTPTNDDLLQRKAGAWTNRTPAQVKTDLALTKSDVGLSNVDNTSDATKNAAVATLTNKSIDADANTITNIDNADIKSGAAIAVNKLAALTVSRAVVTDGSGFVSAATTTSTEIGYVNGVTSAIQTQLDSKQPDIQFQDEGSNAGTSGGVSTVNFTGAGVSASESAGVLTVNISGTGSGQAAVQFQDEGSNLGTAGTVETIDFVGSGVTASRVSNVLTVTVSGGGGGGGNSFETINCPAGTDPVADSSTDTLNLTSTGSTIVITGDSSTDTVNFDVASTVTTNAGTQTLTNKTLTSPVINTPTGIVKGDVGLGNVDNTSDATKNSATATLTNKTIDADANTITNIENADIKAGAAIAVNKLAAVTASRALVSDGSGFVSASSVTSTEVGHLSGVTSSIQTQLGTKAPLASPTFTGTVSGITATMVGLGNVDNTSDATKNAATATLTNKTLSDAVNSVTTPTTTSVGYLGAPQRSISADDTFVLSDAGKHLYHPSADTTARAWTIPANSSVAYPIGTVIAIVNDNAAGAITLGITTDTLRWGSSTGSRTIAANGTATLLKVTSTSWRLTGDGIT